MVHQTVGSSTQAPVGRATSGGQPVPVDSPVGVPTDYEGEFTIGLAPGAIGFLILLGVFPVAVGLAFYLAGRWASVLVALVWLMVGVVYANRSARRL
jgi:hypothetical protein